MRTRPNTCMPVYNPPVTISLWWNSVSYGPVDQSPLFSRTSRYTHLRNIYPRLKIPSAKTGRRGKRSSSVKLVAFSYVHRRVTASWPDCISALSTYVLRRWICTILPEYSISFINDCAITYLIYLIYCDMWRCLWLRLYVWKRCLTPVHT